MSSPDMNRPGDQSPIAQSPARNLLDVRSLVLGAVIGLIAGAGGVGFIWGLSIDGFGAATDARTACEILARSTPVDDVLTSHRRLGAARVLADAAAGQDGNFQPLAEAMKKVTDLAAITVRHDGSEFVAAIKEAEDRCVEL